MPDRYLRTKRGNVNVVLGDFTMHDWRMQTNITVEEILPSTYYWRKCEVS